MPVLCRLRWELGPIVHAVNAGEEGASARLAEIVAYMARTPARQLEADLDEIRAALRLAGDATPRILSWLEAHLDAPNPGHERLARRAFWAQRRAELGL